MGTQSTWGVHTEHKTCQHDQDHPQCCCCPCCHAGAGCCCPCHPHWCPCCLATALCRVATGPCCLASALCWMARCPCLNYLFKCKTSSLPFKEMFFIPSYTA